MTIDITYTKVTVACALCRKPAYIPLKPGQVPSPTLRCPQCLFKGWYGFLITPALLILPLLAKILVRYMRLRGMIVRKPRR